MKSFIKYLLKTIQWFFLLLSIFFITAFSFSFISTNPEKTNCQKEKEIFISTNGIHLDIIIPTGICSKKLKTELSTPQNTRYISFGWGDQGFYLQTPTWDELKLSIAFKAIFLNSETAMHVTNYHSPYGDWQKVEICESQLEIILEHINQSFKRNKSGEIMEIKDSGYSKYDKFYEAKGSYNCFNTCNDWVNRALKKAGVKTSVWSPFDFGVLHHVK